MGKFDGILICTDLDGTLFKNDKTISQENRDAIEYFKANGGYFTFITGRMPFFVSYALECIKPNAPFGSINGGGLFDAGKNEYVWKAHLPEKALEMAEFIGEVLPGVGIQINTFYKTYFVKENETMEKFRQITNLPNLVCGFKDVREPVAKILFGTEIEEEIQHLEKALKAHPLAGEFDFIRSEKTLYEILPKGIGKGAAIENLCRHLGVCKTVAIGDYNNDISMFKAAKIGIAVENACSEAKKAADFITVSNEKSAVAEVIYGIECGKYKL